MSESNFQTRLRMIIGDKTVSAFARHVGLSESLIRKYLKGSDPSLSRAQQIANRTGCSLNWLASGQGRPLNEDLFIGAMELTKELQISKNSLTEEDEKFLRQFLEIYKHLELTSFNAGFVSSNITQQVNQNTTKSNA